MATISAKQREDMVQLENLYEEITGINLTAPDPETQKQIQPPAAVDDTPWQLTADPDTVTAYKEAAARRATRSAQWGDALESMRGSFDSGWHADHMLRNVIGGHLRDAFKLRHNATLRSGRAGYSICTEVAPQRDIALDYVPVARLTDALTLSVGERGRYAEIAGSMAIEGDIILTTEPDFFMRDYRAIPHRCSLVASRGVGFDTRQLNVIGITDTEPAERSAFDALFRAARYSEERVHSPAALYAPPILWIVRYSRVVQQYTRSAKHRMYYGEGAPRDFGELETLINNIRPAAIICLG